MEEETIGGHSFHEVDFLVAEVADVTGGWDWVEWADRSLGS